ncbi:MAG: alanine racemase [Rickettsiales bacterium]|nr:alanine racemase [Rickettsiales bacterium]|tara:strand:+ start:453 stop:1601 length:1149 start_codon:yes stop_codon:yes gene_type:complete
MAPSVRHRPTVANIDLAALRHNLQVVRSQLPGPHASLMAAVKADAYGHGLLPVATTLAREGLGWFGVAIVEEGLQLRAAGIDADILVLGGFLGESHGPAIAAGLCPVLYRAEDAERLQALAREQGREVRVHLKVDTGMNRLGVPLANLDGFLDMLESCPRLKLDGVLTHLSAAEEPEADFTMAQLSSFEVAVGRVRARGHEPVWIHAANSAALMTGREPPGGLHCNLYRPGISLYGELPATDLQDSWGLQPVLSLKTAVSFVKWVEKGASLSYGRTWTAPRRSLIATLPVGYGDGYPRALSNRSTVLIKGQRAPVVGRVCMDLTLVDVTELGSVREGDEVVLIGEQGGGRVTAGELARSLNTISYEVLSGIGSRVPREYEDL